VVVWHAYQGAEEAALTEATRAWAEGAGEQVSLVAIPFGAYDSKLETAIPRGNGPDLFVAAHASLGKWSSMGMVAPSTLDPTPFAPISVEALSLEGRLYGAPLAMKSVLLLYDPAKVTEPPATTDALIEAARGFSGDGSYGLAYEAPWFHAFGATPFDAQGRVALDTPAFVDALRFARRLGVEEGVVPAQPKAELIGRLYADGRAAFVISGPWFVADATRPIAAAPLPVVSESGQPARPWLTVEGAFVTAGSPRAAQAQALAAWLAGPQGGAVRQERARQAVPRADLPSTDPLVVAQRAQAESAILMPADPRMPTVFEAQGLALRRLMRGAIGPEDAAREAQALADVLTRPRPPAASPLPYLLVMGAVLLGVLAWAFAPLRQAAERARLARHAWDYLWVAPAALSLSVLVVLPFLTGAAVSLFAHHQGEWTFVGLANFVDIALARDFPITSPYSFAYTLVVTVMWTVANLALHVGLGVALALVLREPWVRLRAFWRAALILPWAIPNYITALIWKGMFHVQYGAINALLSAGLGRPVEVDWFGSFVLAFGANLATNTWLGFPFMMVVTLGALQSIPRDLEEAAEMDGAGWWFRFRHVVWPLLQPALLPAVLLGSVWTFNMFNVIYLVSGGEPDGSTEILISEAYRWAFSRGNRYGYASAYAVLIFLVLLVYARGANRLAGRKVL
jgi:arabinogalactan oligomer/maltooligosaccharide transport system permease protein